MHAGHTHEKRVHPELADGLNSNGTYRHDRVLEKTAANKNDLDCGVLNQLCCDGRAVRDDGRFQLRMEISCDLSGRCSSVENYRLSILHHPSRCSSDRALSILVQKFTAAEINDCRRRRKSSSMHPLKAAFLGQL